MITGFDHFTVIVRDPRAAAARYGAFLGTEPTWRGEHPELGTRAVLFGLWNSVLELVGPVQGDERAEGMQTLLESRGEGLYAMALATEDADVCRRTMRERGIRCAPPEEGQARSLHDGALRSYRSVELSPRATRGLSVLCVQRNDAEDLLGSAQRSASSVGAIDHVVVRSAAPDGALGLYGEGLGIRLALDRDLAGTRMLFFRVGKLTLEVVQDATLGDEDSFGGLAYRVGDMDAAHKRMADAGFDVSDIRDGNKQGTQVFSVRGGLCGVPTLIIRDPSRD